MMEKVWLLEERQVVLVPGTPPGEYLYTVSGLKREALNKAITAVNLRHPHIGRSCSALLFDIQGIHWLTLLVGGYSYHMG